MNKILSALSLFAVLFAGSGAPAEPAYPARPVKIVLGFPAGTSVDVIVRVQAKRLEEHFKQPFIVENRLGASGNIATAAVARSAPDGLTLLANGVSLAAGVSLFKNLPFDLLKDLEPVAFFGNAPYVLVVSPSLGIKSVAELIALAKSRPGELTYGSPGVGTGPAMSAELFALSAGLRLTHIPYHGTNQAIIDLLGGRLSLMFAPAPTVAPLLNDKKVQVLAVSTAKRSALFPDLPTLEEAGVANFDTSIWYAMWAPKGTPPDIISALNSVMVASMKDEEFKAILAKNGAEPLVATPAELDAFVRAEIKKWKAVVEYSGLTLE